MISMLTHIAAQSQRENFNCLIFLKACIHTILPISTLNTYCYGFGVQLLGTEHDNICFGGFVGSFTSGIINISYLKCLASRNFENCMLTNLQALEVHGCIHERTHQSLRRLKAN